MKLSRRARAYLKNLQTSSFSVTPKKIVLLVVAVAALIGFFWYINQYIFQFRAAQTGIDITLQPTQSIYYVGDQIVVNLQASGHENSRPLAFDLHITYDSTRICYKGDPSGNCFANTGFSQISNYFQAPLYENVQNISGGMKEIHLVVLSQQGTQNTVSFNLNFAAVASGITNIRFTDESVIAGATVDDVAIEYLLPDVLATINVGEGSNPGTCTCAANEVTSNNCNTGFVPQCTDTNVCGCYPDSPTPTWTPTPSGPTPLISVAPSATRTPTPSPTRTPTPTLSPGPGTLSPTAPITVTSAPGSAAVELNVKLRFQGIVKAPAPGRDIMRVSTIISSSDKAFRQEQAIDFKADSAGIWTGTMNLANVPLNKTYQVFIKGPMHLMRRICELDPREPVPGFYKCAAPAITLKAGANTLDISQVYQLAGDLPVQNGIVDAVDITFIRSNFGSKEPVHTAQGDLNRDGIIDTQDYTLILVSLGFKYDEQ